jgi:hypothetical protein
MENLNIFYFFYRLAGWALLFAIAAKSTLRLRLGQDQKDLGKMIRHFILPH